MVPTIPARVLDLYPCVLDGHAMPDTVLPHSNPVQSPDVLSLSDFSLLRHESVAIHEPQGLARVAHAVVLPLKLELVRPSLLSREDLPCTVNGPVAKITLSTEAERPWSQGVLEMVADLCWKCLLGGCGSAGMSAVHTDARVLLWAALTPGLL